MAHLSWCVCVNLYLLPLVLAWLAGLQGLVVCLQLSQHLVMLPLLPLLYNV